MEGCTCRPDKDSGSVLACSRGVSVLASELLLDIVAVDVVRGVEEDGGLEEAFWDGVMGVGAPFLGGR